MINSIQNKHSKKYYSGSALVLTTMAIAAMTIIALGVAQLVPKDLRQSQALEASLQAESAAWAGVEHGLLLLKNGQENASFFELATNNQAPFGRYIANTLTNLDCMASRGDSQCRGLDRQLGSLGEFSPYKIDDLNTSAQYSLLIWHRRANVGNPQAGDLQDSLSEEINDFPNNANINPVLLRDEVRRLDMQDVAIGSSVTLYAESVHKPQGGCDALDSATQMGLGYTWLQAEGKPSAVQGTRSIQPLVAGALRRSLAVPLVVTRPADSSVLSLRLFVTNPNDSKVKECFIRYAIKNNPDETADLGFDVIESTGQSAQVRRKIRVLVNRENGRPLNILDFGLICGENCSGLQ